MNQSLINELRACEIKIRMHIKTVEGHKEDPMYPLDDTQVYANLLLAQSNCLNGIATLVAGKARITNH